MEVLTALSVIWLWLMAAFVLLVLLDIGLRGRVSEILLSPWIERSLKREKEREKADRWRVESGRVFPKRVFVNYPAPILMGLRRLSIKCVMAM